MIIIASVSSYFGEVVSFEFFGNATYHYNEGDIVTIDVRKSGPLDAPMNFRVFGEGLIDTIRAFDAGIDATDSVQITFNTIDNDVALEPNRVFTVSLQIFPSDSQNSLNITETRITVFDDDSKYMYILTSTSFSKLFPNIMLTLQIQLCLYIFTCNLTSSKYYIVHSHPCSCSVWIR